MCWFISHKKDLQLKSRPFFEVPEYFPLIVPIYSTLSNFSIEYGKIPNMNGAFNFCFWHSVSFQYNHSNHQLLANTELMKAMTMWLLVHDSNLLGYKASHHTLTSKLQRLMASSSFALRFLFFWRKRNKLSKFSNKYIWNKIL